MWVITEHFNIILLSVGALVFCFAKYLEFMDNLREEKLRPTKYRTLEFVTHNREIHTVTLERNSWLLPKTEVYRKIKNKYGEKVFVNELNEEVDLRCILPTKTELL